MFYHVLAALPSEVVADVRDILLSPDPITPFQQLRDALIRRTSISEHKRLEQLLADEALGDLTPSQLLRRLICVKGERKIDTGLFTQIFLKRLPQHVQAILAPSVMEVPIDKLAMMADRILDVQPQVNSLDHHTPGPSNNDLSDRITRLSQQLNEMSISRAPHFRRRLRSPSRNSKCRNFPRSPSRFYSHSSSSSQASNPAFCWYHQTFGPEARKCRHPCTFKSQLRVDFKAPGNE